MIEVKRVLGLIYVLMSKRVGYERDINNVKREVIVKGWKIWVKDCKILNLQKLKFFKFIFSSLNFNFSLKIQSTPHFILISKFSLYEITSS